MNLIFSTDFEDGTFNAFDTTASSGIASKEIQSQIVHSGTKAAKLTIKPVWYSKEPGMRLGWVNRDGAASDNPENLPNIATYAAWYYLPTYVKTTWNNLMQWKGRKPDGSREPILSVRLLGENNLMTLNLRHRVAADGTYIENGPVIASSPLPVPVAEWFEIVTYYEYSKMPTGRITSWLNNQLLWDVSGIATEFSYAFYEYPRQVAWNNYAGNVNPSPYSLYIDDVRVWTE